LVIQAGGQGVLEITLTGGAFQNRKVGMEERPYFWKNQSVYLEQINTRSIEDFLQGKPRGRFN